MSCVICAACWPWPRPVQNRTNNNYQTREHVPSLLLLLLLLLPVISLPAGPESET